MVVLLVVAGVLSGAAVLSLDQWRHGAVPFAKGPIDSSPSTLVAAGARGGPAAVAALDPAQFRLRGSATSTVDSRPARGPVVRAADVLRAWDRRRARAWAEGDVPGLRELYVDRAGVADVRLLRRYADRGYRVQGLTTQLLAVDVLDKEPDRWVLRVTDRLAGAVAVRGGERVPLPRDRRDTHVVALVRGDDGRWRVAVVRAA